MQEYPLVSIIIPTYNRAHLISETLDSVLAQTYQNWECIVVDDGSTDATEALLHGYMEKDKRFQYHKRPDSHLPGGNGARNYGFEVSSGEFIQWFDDDDVMLPGFIIKRLALFNECCDLVICSAKIVDNSLTELSTVKLTLNSILFKDYVLKKIKIVTNNVLFKKEFLKDKYLFLEHLLRSQEAEFFSRLFFQLPESKYTIINRPLFLYRQHENTKTSVDKTYHSKFKEAHFLVHSSNLTRGILLKDADVITACYKNLIKLLFEAISNKDDYLIENQLAYLHKVLTKQNYLIIKLSVYWLKITRLARYYIKYYLMQLNINVNKDIDTELLNVRIN
ncbi:glycosyltransferase family 2 protein [Xanthomarina gelatinilytica]|uniref:glycosyltransferase family 2 protein n=1 Tax=Xanthomarina gelatinilytica TaxID=1137281 RepID=UPI003AA9D779